MFKAYLTMGAVVATYVVGACMVVPEEKQTEIFGRTYHGTDKLGLVTGIFLATLVAWPIPAGKTVMRTVNRKVGLVT